MNIFYLDKDPQLCAESHCDKHVVKMIVEYAQLMSTAHRVLDGSERQELSVKGRRIKRYAFDNDQVKQDTIYQASHINHPSNIWVRTTDANYRWLYRMWVNLCKEYTKRYGKTHSTYSKLNEFLVKCPFSIRKGNLTDIPLAMPDDVKESCAVQSYRHFYNVYKKDFAVWKNSKKPIWMT
jgi:hypothetical protein